MDEFNLMVSEQSRMWGSRSKRTKNNAPLVNGQAVEENEVFYYTVLGGKKWAFYTDT